MGYWIKYFADGQIYKGTDLDVSLKRASWRNSRQEGLIKVLLEESNLRIELNGPGEYWQADTMVATMEESEPTVIRRTLQKKIDSQDRFYGYEDINFGGGVFGKRVFFFNGLPLGWKHSLIQISSDFIGKWFTLSLDLENNKVKGPIYLGDKL